VGLRAEVVDLRGLHLRDNVHEIGAVAQVAVVQLELVWAWNRVKTRKGEIT
jgi:hypothetical protein